MNPSKELDRLRGLNAWAIERAMAMGADGAFVSTQSGLSSKVSYEKNDFSLVSSHRGGGLSITIHKDERCGGVGINSFERDEVEGAISRALDLARPTIPDPYIALAPQADYLNLETPWDDELVGMEPEQLLDLLSHLMKATRVDDRVSLDHVAVDRSVGVRCISNSEGMVATDRHAQLNWSLMGMAIEGDDVTGFDYLGNRARRLDDANAKMEASARELSSRLLGQLRARPLEEGYRGKVLLPPSLVEELLVDPLVYHLQGSQIMDGKSRMADSLGEKVAHESFTLKDTPHDTELRGATAFSGEGIPTEPMVLVESGKLKTHVDSLYSSRRRGTRPTGNGGGPHASCLAPGQFDRNELIGRAGRPVLFPSRFSGNLDPVSGDFSGVAKGATLEEVGVKPRPIKEVMISGNIFEILLAPMSVGRELKTDGGYYRLPDILVDEVSVISH